MANSPRALATIGCADLVAAGGEVGDWALIRMPPPSGAAPAQDILPGRYGHRYLSGYKSNNQKFRVLTADPHSLPGPHRPFGSPKTGFRPTGRGRACRSE